jgi:thiol-disulfide isomerase/thioredoxin
MKFLSLSIIAMALSLVLVGCGGSDNEAKTIVEDNTSFDELKAQSNKTYRLKTLEGKVITVTVENQKLVSKDLEGKVVLINFWATWCPPCKKEIPTFNALYEKYQDKFEILGVLYEKGKDIKELEAFVKEFKMKFPVTIDEAENFRMAKAFDDVKRVPESFIYGADGTFLEKFVGVVDEKVLEEYINAQ